MRDSSHPGFRALATGFVSSVNFHAGSEGFLTPRTHRAGHYPSLVNPRLLRKTDIGRHDVEIFEPHRSDGLAEHRHRVEIIDRDAKEPLDLAGVEVERDDAIIVGGKDRRLHDVHTTQSHGSAQFDYPLTIAAAALLPGILRGRCEPGDPQLVFL